MTTPEAPIDDAATKRVSAWEEKIRAVIQREYPRFRRAAWSHCRSNHNGNDEMIDAVVEEAVLSCLNDLEGYDESRGTLGAWIAGRIRWIALNHKRKVQRNPSLEVSTAAPEELSPARSSLGVPGEAMEIHQVLSELLVEIPVEQAEAWTMNKLEGLTLVEVAQEQGVSLAAATGRVRLAGEKIKALFEARYGKHHAVIPLVSLAGAGDDGAFERWLRALQERARAVGDVPAGVRERLQERVREELIRRGADLPSWPPPAAPAAPRTTPRMSARRVWVERALAVLVGAAAVESVHMAQEVPEPRSPVVTFALAREVAVHDPAGGLVGVGGRAIDPTSDPAAQAQPELRPTAGASRPTRATTRSGSDESAAVATEENSLLELARHHIEEGPIGAAAAREALARHRTAFPRSPRAQQRESLEIRALALQGRLDEANAAAARFRTTYQHSPYLASIDGALRR